MQRPRFTEAKEESGSFERPGEAKEENDVKMPEKI